MLNQNEKYLLQFISNNNAIKSQDSLVDVVLKMGIEIKARDFNPVYQIIDEINFSTYKKRLIGK